MKKGKKQNPETLEERSGQRGQYGPDPQGVKEPLAALGWEGHAWVGPGQAPSLPPLAAKQPGPPPLPLPRKGN